MCSKKFHIYARYPGKWNAGNTNMKVSRNLLLAISSIKTPIIKDNYTYKETLSFLFSASLYGPGESTQTAIRPASGRQNSRLPDK